MVKYRTISEQWFDSITEPGRYILTLTNGNGCITQDSILILQDVSKPLVYLDFDTLTCLLEYKA